VFLASCRVAGVGCEEAYTPQTEKGDDVVVPPLQTCDFGRKLQTPVHQIYFGSTFAPGRVTSGPMLGVLTSTLVWG
jgi:hypothetical protein